MGISAELSADRHSLWLFVQRSDWIGRRATLSLCRQARVKRSNGVHHEASVHDCQLLLSSARVEVPLPAPLDVLDYDGAAVCLRHVLRLTVDDGVLFDSTLEIPLPLYTLQLPSHPAHSTQWIQPPDRYSLWTNLRSLAPLDRLKAVGMMVVCAVLMLVNMAVGWRDQWVPESQVWFYDHSGTKDGKRTSESPLVKAGTGSAAIGAGAFALLLKLLRRYMRFELKLRSFPRRGVRTHIREVLTGTARIPLSGATVRVVAANIEKGRETVKRDKKTEVRSFSVPGPAVILYERNLPSVPAQVAIDLYLDGEVDFDLAYAQLHPPILFGAHHGVGLVWEIQLIHPELVDQEVQGSTAEVQAEDFLRSDEVVAT
jgi:hypothetical protein